MEEIYWIQRLGALNIFLWVIFGVSLGILFTSLLLMVGSFEDLRCGEEISPGLKWYKKVCIICLTLSTLSGTAEVFIPTTKEMYMIYGVGGTIDYLKENETAKKLPDKVINALDKWVDNLSSEKGGDE